MNVFVGIGMCILWVGGVGSLEVVLGVMFVLNFDFFVEYKVEVIV